MTYSRRQLEALGEPFGECATKLKPGGRIYGGGGSPSTPTEVSQRTVGYSKEYEPIVREAVDRAVYEASKPYETYQGQRLAGFDPMQLQAQQALANLGPSQQLGTATQMTGLAGLRAGQMQYAPTQFSARDVASTYTPTDIQTERVTGGGYKPGQFTPDQVAAQRLQSFQMRPSERVGSERTATQSFAMPGMAGLYMSPYMQNVVDIQNREAMRQAGIAATQRGAQAVGMGAYGGSRQAILEAEAQRNLAQQMGDIQAKGSQAAYEQAAAQFQADQARMLQSQQANQQAALQAGLANQAMGLTVGRENLAAQLGVQQLGAQQQMQAALANQQAKIEAQRQREAAQQFAAQQEMQKQLANQQAMMEATRLREQAGQFGAGQAMQAGLANQQAALEAQRMAEQSRQYGAGLGLQGLQQQLSAASQLGALGQTQFGQQQAIINAQAAAGAQRQALQQQKLTQAYEDFLAQKQHPYQQIAFMQEMAKGTPQQTTQAIYAAPASLASQAAGLGSIYLGGKAAGVFANGGLTDLALYNMTK